MGTTIELDVPEGQERAVIEAYYDYVVNKLHRRDAEWAPESKADYADYELTIERYANDGECYLYEQIPNTVAEHVDWDRVRALFAGDENGERILCDDEDLGSLIELLRAAIEPLEAEQPHRNWGDNLETQVIALCEFARRNEYCIELVPG